MGFPHYSWAVFNPFPYVFHHPEVIKYLHHMHRENLDLSLTFQPHTNLHIELFLNFQIQSFVCDEEKGILLCFISIVGRPLGI